MVPLKKDISINLNKLMEFVLPKREKYIQSKVILYIRLYTGVVRIEDNIKSGTYKRVLHLVKVVRNMSRNNDFKEEEVFLKRIQSITNDVQKWAQLQIKRKRKHDVPDAYHILAAIQIAQNLCVLRILKREEK